MSKTKRRLRADAVERLSNYEEWHKKEKAWHEDPDLLMAVIGGKSWGSTWQENCAALIDLLTDEEPPEGDVVAILRKWANFWGVSHSTHTQCDSNWEVTTMQALADMIERDYVRRDSLSCPDCARELERVTSERDELEKRVDYLESRHCEWSDPSSLGDGCMLRKDEYVDALKAERDEWKAKAEQLANDTLHAENDVSDAQGEANDANAALLARIDELTVEKRALEHELKLARGEVKTVLNNTEAAKRKAERAEAEYRERMRKPVEESWKREVELAKSSRDYYKAEMERLRSILCDVRKLAADREKYALVTLADDEGSVVS